MNSSNINSAIGQIQDSLERLTIAWSTTRESWNDRQAIEFEETVLKHLHEQVLGAIPLMTQLAQTTDHVVRECSE